VVEFHESDFKHVLNFHFEGVCYLDAQGELLYSNQAAGIHWQIERSQTNKLTSQSPVARALAGEYVYHELVHLEDNQTLLVNSLPLFSKTNVISGIMVFSQDVSEHMLTEHQAHIALNVLSEAILDTHRLEDPDEVLRRVAALLPQLEAVDKSFAFRLDNETGKLTPLAFYDSDQQSYDAWYSELTALELSTEKVIQQPAPAYIHAIRLARTFMVDFTSDAQHSNTRNLLAAIYAPALFNGRVIGLLGAERHRPPGKAIAYFPHWSVDLLTALARVASMSLEKADLLSSLKGVQNAIEISQAQLKQKDEFLLLTAHELKNPLTAIRGQAQILQRRLKKLMQAQTGTLQQTNDLMSGAESIEHQTYRIAHMINTLLEVSRADLGRVNISLQDIDLVQLAQRTLKEHIPLAPRHDLRLVVNREPQPILAENTTSTSSIIIQGDELRLEQVLSNLVGNAIKYSPDGGPITLSVRTAGEYVELSVEDQGIGIPIKEQARLTERFYRAENAVESNTQGLGLGLYLVHSLVTLHGGRMTIKSEGVPGKGSAFTIELPTKAQ